ncbi:hypothetical protein MKW92_003624 [Papaver armeniacum]|nr:hypothetical protein MKW92_003624 [Papaver armeniacum]
MKLSIWDMLSTWPHHGVKKKATSILVGFGYLLGASILVLTVSSFIFPSVFASITNPLLKENLDRYYLKFGFTNWHNSPSRTSTAATPAENSATKNNFEKSSVDLAGKLVYTGEGSVPSSANFSSDCDIFEGEWVMAKDPKQYYAPGSCPYLEARSFDCHGNGRPDDEYLKWQWKWQSHPRNAGCKDNIPSFLNATDFLERLRSKKLVFVGDSLNRNMYMSMACILWNAIPDKKRIDYNCTMAFVWSAFLVRSIGVSKSTQETVRLDLIDEQAASAYRDADVLVFDSGHWWVPKKTNNGVNFFQEGDNLYPQLDVNEAYRKGLTTWRKWVDKHIDSNKTQVVFRGFSPTHFKGKWSTGRGCNLATEPIPSNETYIKPTPIQLEILESTLRKMKTHVLYLNISKLSYYRADAHPSVYRNVFKNYTFQERIEASQDCSHWCLPGVPDTWNELLYVALLKDGKGYFGKL